MYNQLSVKELIQKLESFCAYQERCHQEVESKLRSMTSNSDEIGEVIVHLLQNNYLNEERFARAFARGKNRIKYWGKSRIVNELKQRKISETIIRLALTEIDADEYDLAFEVLATRQWESIRETNVYKKRKKFCDFLLRKGYDSGMVYEMVRKIERLKD